MSEDSKINPSPVPLQDESDVLALLKKMQQQLLFLEKKIDALINQSQERPPVQEKSFSRPFRPSGQSSRPYEGRRDQGPRDRGFSRERPSHSSGERSFSRDRPSHGSGERSFQPGNRFDKPQGGGNRGFDPKKKPFSHHRRRDRP